MAKEFDKFAADYKKLQPAIAKYTKDTTAKVNKEARVQFLETNDQGEEHLTEAIAKARGNGVTGVKPADYMKDKDFADARKVFALSVGKLRQKVGAVERYSLEAGDTNTKVVALVAAIQKDLKSRSGRSESKTQIEALLVDVEKPAKVLAEAAAAYSKMPKAWVEYGEKEDATVERLLKAAPEVAQQRRDATMLPQMLVDRNRKKYVGQAGSAAQEIVKACDDAITLAATDMAAAKNALKPAADRLKALQKVRDEFGAAYDNEVKSNSAFKETKDYEAITKAKQTIDKAYEIAERKLRGAITTMRKSG